GSWVIEGDWFDTIGRLWEAGEENYIFRQEKLNTAIRFSFAKGNPSQNLKRYSVGYSFISADFSQATLEDYDDLDLDPDRVGNDPDFLAENRRFSGPIFGYEQIQPNFVPMNYIDRFDFTEDFNLGNDLITSLMIAPRVLGSRENS